MGGGWTKIITRHDLHAHKANMHTRQRRQARSVGFWKDFTPRAMPVDEVSGSRPSVCQDCIPRPTRTRCGPDLGDRAKEPLRSSVSSSTCCARLRAPKMPLTALSGPLRGSEGMPRALLPLAIVSRPVHRRSLLSGIACTCCLIMSSRTPEHRSRKGGSAQDIPG